MLVVAEESEYKPAAANLGPARLPLDLLCNGVWQPIHQALSSRLNSIFAPGIASILHSNYVISMDFLNELAGIAGPSYEAAMRRR